MSLLTELMETFVIMDKVTSPDGYGGVDVMWVDGAPITATATFDTSMQSRIADKQGVTSLYTVTTSKSVNLQFHEVIRRVSDGKIFRITSDGDDKKTPASATLNMRQVTAEEWELPDGQVASN